MDVLIINKIGDHYIVTVKTASILQMERTHYSPIIIKHTDGKNIINQWSSTIKTITNHY